jgi:hypothetical protein
MIKKEYTNEEKEILEKWGAQAELEFDTSRILISPITGKKITALGSAKSRRDTIEEIKKLKQYKSA